MTTLQTYVIAEFDDGIQIIPNLWINDDVTKVRWPSFSSQKRFDKAVKEIEEWQESWSEFPLKKILGSTSSYDKARQKLKDAEIFSDIPSGSDRDEILKRTRKTRAKYVQSNDEETESEDEQVVKVPHFPKFPERSCTKEIKTNKIKKGNGVASFKLCKENIPMRTKLSSKFQKNSETENGGKLVEVVKKVKNNMPNTPKSDSEMSDLVEVVKKVKNNNVPNTPKSDSEMSDSHQTSGTDELVESLKESSVIGTGKELLQGGAVQSKNAGSNFQHKFWDAPTNSSTNEDYYRFIVRKLISLNLEIKALREGQEKILKKLDSFSEQKIRQPESPEEVETIDIWHNLPLKDERALQELEVKLKEDEKYRKKLIKELANIGGRDMKNFALKIMRQTFTNELAVKYSWVGGKKKNVFVDLMICKVILSALRKHYNMTEEELSAPIKIWLAHAKERCSKVPLNAQN
ncbi:PREDICTED: uncharacterized protein LOC105449044 [Wasmannia auropunctata]|uniref:uncharacterized protein LOC105449044 n=1 Tax=Wasmannia auropunctata TaxID=64793 RepID=UPI0005ED7FC3|nr:PREDICTED: uncharacterized protein LOC105449044 [Wasmannia auropunctata]